MKIKPLQEGFAAIISNLDCRQTSIENFYKLKAALFKHKVLIIRKQTMDTVEYAKFMRRFGRPIFHPLKQFSLPHLREVLIVSNLYNSKEEPYGIHEGGAYWHSDMSYLPYRNILTALYAEQTPLTGGQTCFVDCATAWKKFQLAHVQGNLSPALAALQPKDLTLLHQFGNRQAKYVAGASSQKLTASQKNTLTSVEHPLVITHPISYDKSFYAVAGTAMGIVGMTDKMATRLLDKLQEFILSQAPQFEHFYEAGDLVIWDNVSTLHRGVPIEKSYSYANCRWLYRINIDYMGRQSD